MDVSTLDTAKDRPRLAIFLHFLNREPYRAVNAEYSPVAAEQLLRALAMASYEELYSNLSNLLEGDVLNPNRPTLVRSLLETDQLLVEGERPSVTEFIDSREQRYKYDATRYPMYFGEKPTVNVPLTRIRSQSITNYLRDQITKVAQQELNAPMTISTHDRNVLNRQAGEVLRIMGSRDTEGITKSLFENKHATNELQTVAARLASAFYIQKYMTDLGSDIAWGIRQLLPFDELASKVWWRHVGLLRAVLSSYDLDSSQIRAGQLDSQIAAARGSDAQVQFSDSIRILAQVASLIAHPGEHPSYVVRRLIRIAKPDHAYPTPSADLFSRPARDIQETIRRLRNHDSSFAASYENLMTQKSEQKTILLVTATKAETSAMIAVAERQMRGPAVHIPKDNYIATDLGQLGRIRFIHVQCEPGSVGASSSQAVIGDAIRDWTPDAIVMGGIAFGTKKDKQKLGDILVSKSIMEYERAKVTETRAISRGQRIESAPKLLSVFRTYEVKRQRGPTMHVGLILSGEKLVDSENLVNSLLEIEPEAIGGEMEGAGLVAAASRARVDWIVIKAIVDWGFDKQANNDSIHQENVARGAFEVIFEAFANVGL
jgi:nucleoside phosphorylase